jgi:hypothetical protein
MKNPYHFDDDEEIEDGHSVRVPMMIMDGNRVNLSDTVRFEDGQPHFVRMADVAGESSIEDVESPRDLDALRDAARAARSAWIKQLGDAWRTPPRGARDAAEPDAAEALLHRAPAPHDDPAAALRHRRCAARNRRCAQRAAAQVQPTGDGAQLSRKAGAGGGPQG